MRPVAPTLTLTEVAQDLHNVNERIRDVATRYSAARLEADVLETQLDELMIEKSRVARGVDYVADAYASRGWTEPSEEED